MDKAKAREAALAAIKKTHGADSISIYGDKPSMKVETISSGSMGVDIALGGGLPRGRIVEIYGPEASGKTTMTLHAIAEAQRLGGMAAFIDAEHALDPEYATALGVNMEDLVISQPNSGEEALEIAQTLVKSNAFDVIVVDSVAALVPQVEIDNEMGKHQPGLQAKLMSQACRKLSPLISKSKTIFFFINQIRSKIGVMYGSPDVTSGGNALKFYSSVRMDIRRISSLKDGDEAYGNRVRVKVAKNKVAPPHKKAEFDIIYGKGVNYLGEVLDYATHLKLVDKSGAWYVFDEDTKLQGRNAALEHLEGDQKLVETLAANIRKEYRLDKDE